MGAIERRGQCTRSRVCENRKRDLSMFAGAEGGLATAAAATTSVYIRSRLQQRRRRARARFYQICLMQHIKGEGQCAGVGERGQGLVYVSRLAC